jgi:L-threonylcarbamoyladenylate synthase
VPYYATKFDNEVIKLLKKGGVGILPTDTIYGLSALALKKDAVERIHHLKGRDDRKPLIVLIANFNQLDKLGLNREQADFVKNYWPGPVSLEFDAHNAPVWLHRGGFTFAVRMPDSKVLRDLIAIIGPIVSTSANLQGGKPAKSVKQAQKYFGDQLDFYVDGGKLEGQSSTLIKIENGKLKVLRQGAYEIKF